MEEKKKLNFKILIPSMIVIIVIVVGIVTFKGKGNNTNNSDYYKNSVFSNLKTFTEITGIKENSIKEEAIINTYIYQYQDTYDFENDYEKYLLNDYGFKINQDTSEDNIKMFEYNGNTLIIAKEVKAGFKTYKIKIPFTENIANENIKNYYENAMNLIEDKEYLQARKILALDGVRDYKDSLKYIYYCNGMQAYKYKNYGDAIEHFSKYEDFLNSKELKDKLIGIIGKYNGIYYTDNLRSPDFPQYPISGYMFVKDGKVEFELKSSYKSGESINYLYDLIEKSNTEELMIAYPTGGDEPKETDYEYYFKVMEDGSIMVKNYETNSYTTYNAIYNKISDTAPNCK